MGARSQMSEPFWKKLLNSAVGSKIKETPKKTLVEGIHGTWHYHLSDDGKTALCGAWVMRTGVPEDTWGYVGHLNERYCKQCERIRNEQIN
jgi:hypothetical protein